MRLNTRRAALLFGAVAMIGTTAATTATTVTVTESDPTTVAINSDSRNTTPYEFTLDRWSIGSGSLHVLPIANDDNTAAGDGKADKFTAAVALASPAPDFGGASVDFLVEDATSGTRDEQFYINVYALTDAPASWFDCRYDYVADNGSETSFATLDASGAADSVEDRHPVVDCGTSPADLPPTATVVAVVVNVGDTSLNDTGVGGYLDNLQVTVDSATTVYDFEVPTPVKADCKDGGYVELGYDNQGSCVSALQANTNAGKS